LGERGKNGLSEKYPFLCLSLKTAIVFFGLASTLQKGLWDLKKWDRNHGQFKLGNDKRNGHLMLNPVESDVAPWDALVPVDDRFSFENGRHFFNP
jgi:hypothetical protein